LKTLTIGISICQYTEEIKIENPNNRYFNLPIHRRNQDFRNAIKYKKENPNLEKRTQCNNQEEYNQENFYLIRRKALRKQNEIEL